jgi:apolipoprotein N-acyltransferase
MPETDSRQVGGGGAAPNAAAFRGIAPPQQLREWAEWLAAQTGWRRYGLALLLGAAGAAALPPVDLVPLLAVSFSGFLWLANGSRGARAAFLLGWTFGLGFFVAGLYWIAFAMLVDIDRFWWLMPFAALGLPALLGFFTGGVGLVDFWVRRHLRLRGAARCLVFALAWCVAEWLRGHVLTGFPWNLVGYVWSGGFPGATSVLQAAALVGIYGLGVLTAAAAALPAALADPPAAAAQRPWRSFAPLTGALLLILVPAGFGAWRLSGGADATVPEVRLRLVQPSIAETLKRDRGEREANFRRHLLLSTAPPEGQPPTAVIWSESAATYFLARDEPHRMALASAVPPGGLLITGAPRSDPPPLPGRNIWNSLAVIDGAGDILATYDKFHLVPFGEYVPFRGILPIDSVAGGTVDYSAGPGPRTLRLPGLPPVGPLICYEVIFPHAVVDEADRPAWLLNLTNDAWYGFTSGPFQHFAITRVRAVEEGLPLVRVANNGISGIIDAHGRVTARLSLDAVGFLDGALPVALPPTPYARWGDRLFLALLFAGAAFVAARPR